MTTFSQMEYKRPDFNALFDEGKALLSRMERAGSAQELFDAAKAGTLEEAFGTGTAAVVSPIGWLSMDGHEFTINDSKIGSLTQRLYDELTALQWGRTADTHGWICPLD